MDQRTYLHVTVRGAKANEEEINRDAAEPNAPIDLQGPVRDLSITTTVTVSLVRLRRCI